jgi:DNA polymerase
VPGEGDADAEVVFVGEAPGASEDRQGRPFVGSAGRLLEALLGEAGLTRDGVYITNVVKARPPGNRDPKADEAAHYWPWLERELAVIAPRFVVPLGRHAMGRFVSGVKISEAHGRPVVDAGPPARTIVPWFHPAAALHNQSLRGALSEDAQRLGELLRG